MLPSLTIGLDLAQSFDFTALVSLEHRPGMQGTLYAARMIERWRFKPYTMLPGLVRQAEEKLRRALADEHFNQFGTAIHPWYDVRVELIVDGSGVGAAAVDVLVDAGLQPVPVIITSGTEVHRRDQGGFTCPKLDLVTVIQLLLEQQRLQIPATLPHAETLAAELRNFKYDFSPSGRMRFGAGPSGGEDVLWRGDGSHDDLILATALAAWHAERQTPTEIDPVLLAAFSDMPGW